MNRAAIRWSGPALASGAVLLGIGIGLVALQPAMNQQISPVVAALLLATSVLLILALPGIFAAQAAATGFLGLAAHILLSSGLFLLVLLAATPLLYPSFKAAPPESPVLFILALSLTLGLLLVSIATYRAGVLSRPGAIITLAAAAGFFFDFFVAEFLPPPAGQIGTALLGLLLALGLGLIGVSRWRIE